MLITVFRPSTRSCLKNVYVSSLTSHDFCSSDHDGLSAGWYQYFVYLDRLRPVPVPFNIGDCLIGRHTPHELRLCWAANLRHN